MDGDVDVSVGSSKVGMGKTNGTVDEDRDIEITIDSSKVGIGNTSDMSGD